MSIAEKISRGPRPLLFGKGLALVLLIGGADYLTGTNLSLSALYLAPIGLVSWYAGKKSGILISLFSVVTISLADYYSGKIYHHYLVELWNTLLLFAFFAVVAALLSGLKSEIEKREKLIIELRNAVDEIRKLSGLLPICAWCKKIRNDQGYWQQVEHYIAEHADVKFTHGICPDCLKKVSPELYARIEKKDVPPDTGDGT